MQSYIKEIFVKKNVQKERKKFNKKQKQMKEIKFQQYNHK